MRTPPQSSEPGHVRRKGTLFCPSCGHESPVDGRWVETTTGTIRTLECPECGAVVDRRDRNRTVDVAEA